MLRTCVPAVFALVFAGCATAGQRAYVAPSDETIVSTMQEGYGDSRVNTVVVENRSTVPVQVYSVTLRNCQNIKQRCGEPRAVNYTVQPGNRQVIARVEPEAERGAFSFRYTYAWRPLASGPAREP